MADERVLRIGLVFSYSLDYCRGVMRGVWGEIRRSHIQRAKDLLTQTQLPMSQVARRTGFTDGKQRSAIFRQETGMTPTAYRRQVQRP